MPKRNKKQLKIDEHEGRPAGLTLASFVQLPNFEGSANATEIENSTTTAADQVSESKTSNFEAQANACSLDQTTEHEIQPEIPPSTKLAYFIGKTKKGKLPLTCENRSKGKKVTVISNVVGDAQALLHELKKRAGCGGVLREGTVELQGDRVLFVTKFLTGHPCVKPYKH